MCVSISIDPSKVILRIWDAMMQPLSYVTKPESNIRALRNAMDKLRCTMDDVKNKAQISQAAGETLTRAACLWLQRVEVIDNEVNMIIVDNEQSKCLGGWSLSCWSINQRAVKKLAEVATLTEEKDFEVMLPCSLPQGHAREFSTMSTVTSLDSYLEKLLLYMGDDKVGMVGIWGMGGVGKTTLLKKLNNAFLAGDKRNARFDYVIWAVVSRDSNLEKLQKNICKMVGLPLQEDSSFQATIIFNFLKDKSFLLLLDDLWRALDLEAVGIPPPGAGGLHQHKSKVVFTTRFEWVCGSMEAQTRVRIECLKPEEAWHLFQEKVGEEIINSDARIREVAWEVARECAGLPLAVITIGRAMSTKKTWQVWENALTLLKKSQLPMISGMADPDAVYLKLKFSYDSLQDDRMKKGFLCCSLWPEDYIISEDELIVCWMGLGLLDDCDTAYETHNRGLSLIESLKEACLLEPGDYDLEVKMHDVIRDMALWIGSECGKEKMKWVVQAGVGLQEVTEEETQRWKGAERISLMRNCLEALPSAPYCPKLSLLMLQQNLQLSRIPPMFFEGMSSLTYLDLSYTSIVGLPKGIGTLVELQFLNLGLTKVRSLPKELGCLRKLKYLSLSYTKHLNDIPLGVISSLLRLECLDMFESKHAEWCDEQCIEELESLEGGLKALGITVTTIKTLQRLSRISQLSMTCLGLSGLKGLTSLQLLSPSLLGSSSTQLGLFVLCIKECLSLEELMIEDNHETHRGCLPKLEVLSLQFLPKLKELRLKGLLQSLRCLTIDSCYKLKNLTWLLQLPGLEFLDMSTCSEVEQVIGNVEHGGSGKVTAIFSRLKTLKLNHLSRLTCISVHTLSFPTLEYLEVIQCPLLKKLPFQIEISNNSRLKQIWGEKKWWESLEWEDDNIRSSLLPLFMDCQNTDVHIPAYSHTHGISLSQRSLITRPMIPTYSALSTMFHSTLHVLEDYMLENQNAR